MEKEGLFTNTEPVNDIPEGKIWILIGDTLVLQEDEKVFVFFNKKMPGIFTPVK